MKDIKINTWLIIPEWNNSFTNYLLDLSRENVNEDEIALCIQEQIYGDKLR